MSDRTPTLRIGKLPDLTPVKMTIHIDPETHRALEDYAAIYAQTYGDKVAASALVPTMLANFLAMDQGFKKARKARGESSEG